VAKINSKLAWIVIGAVTAAALVPLGVMLIPHWLERARPRAAIDGQRPAPHHSWRSVNARHWQIISTDYEEPAVTDAREGNRGQCPAGMVEVSGKMKVDPSTNPFDEGRIETMQLTTCLEWINREYPERCARFDRNAWLALSASLATKPMHFCIDRFEYPNRKGQYPLIYISWFEAVELCDQAGERLCTEDEWTFACEGEEALPYPYGYDRDPQACVVDQHWRPYDEAAMRPRDGEEARYEMDRLWQGVASGSQPRCRSPFGVYDLTGNVDEWTRSVREGERPSILKGGYWGPVRTRCRPSTRSHDQNHMFYQQGLRCCADVGTVKPQPGPGEAAPPPLPEDVL
jgi:formylglycine-generating enzyme